MSHQCLQCGHMFEDVASQILKGCPGCGGNRFFFTKQPLSVEEREIIKNQINKDIPTKIMELAIQKNTRMLKSNETWITIKPKDLRNMVEKRPNQEKTSYEPPNIALMNYDECQTIIKKIKAESNYDNTLETIEVEQPGKYHINLKGLLEKEPIIINKDGTYTIHLPSVFTLHSEKKRKKRK